MVLFFENKKTKCFHWKSKKTANFILMLWHVDHFLVEMLSTAFNQFRAEFVFKCILQMFLAPFVGKKSMKGSAFRNEQRKP